ARGSVQSSNGTLPSADNGFNRFSISGQSVSAGTAMECRWRNATMQASGSSGVNLTIWVPGVESVVVTGVQLIFVAAGIAKSGSACMNGSAFIRARSFCSTPQVSSDANSLAPDLAAMKAALSA